MTPTRRERFVATWSLRENGTPARSGLVAVTTATVAAASALLRLGLVYPEGAAVVFTAVQGAHRLLSVGARSVASLTE
jgi:hypothetical protein